MPVGPTPVPILLLSPVAVPGGAERGLASVAERLPALGYAPHGVLLEHGPLEQWMADAGCPTTVIAAPRLLRLAGTARIVDRVRRLIREGGFRAVVSNQTKGHLYGGTAARLARVPAVFWQRSIPGPHPMDLLASRVPASAVVCSCDAAMTAQRRLTPRVRLHKVHPGVAVGRVAGRAGSGRMIRARLGWDQAPVIGIVARLQSWKGHAVFLRAAALVSAVRPEARFAVVGGAILGWEGDYATRIRALAHTLGIGEVVHFSGHQPDPYPWIDALDIVVNASEAEPFGRSLVEAMALAKAVVATAAGGPLEIVEDGTSGLLVPVGDAHSLARTLIRLVDDTALRSRLGGAAARRATLFDSSRTAASVAGILDDVLGTTALELVGTASADARTPAARSARR